MSSTNRGAVRVTNDGYYTPDELADEVIRSLVVGSQSRDNIERVLEPSVGNGAFARAVRLYLPGAHLDTNDVDPAVRKVPGCHHHVGDFLQYTSKGYDLIVGNPPYSEAMVHVAKAIELLSDRGQVGFVLRLNILASSQYDDFRNGGKWCDHLHRIQVLVPRPSFTDGGSDSAEYGVFWFDRRARIGDPQISWLWWNKKGATKERRRT